MQHIIDENNRDSASWVRDLFISILLTLLPLACELIVSQPVNSQPSSNNGSSWIIQTICTYGAIISLVGLFVWIFVCIWKYSKAVKKYKQRIIPHTIKGTYSIDESVHYFDNDVCNDLILSKHYISLAESEEELAAKEFYYIEALHYFYKSIRIFCIICKSHEDSALRQLFTTRCADTDKRIDIVRLVNYLSLIKSITIRGAHQTDTILLKEIVNYDNSFSAVRDTFTDEYARLKKLFSSVSEYAQNNPTLIEITTEIRNYISKTDAIP